MDDWLRILGVWALVLMPFIACMDAGGGEEGCDLPECIGDCSCHGVVCPPDDNECTREYCSDGSCRSTPVANGTDCTDDGVSGICTDGICGEDLCAGVVCDDGDVCTVGTCDYADGMCDFTPVVCDDGNECTQDACEPLQGCIFTTVEDGTRCAAGGVWMCIAGECVHPCDPAAEEVYSCPIPGFEDQLCCPENYSCTDAYNCDRAYCDPTLEEVYSCPIGGLDELVCCPDSLYCQDVCCHSDNDCNDGNECTEYVCAEGLCEYTPLADGTPCGGDAGTCQSGSCVGTFSCTEQGIRDAIAVGGGPHTFDCGAPTTVVTQATIEIDNDVILNGEGNLMIDGNDDHTVLSVELLTRAELHGLTITGGASGNLGAGIRSYGRLTLTNSRVSGNRTEFGTGGGIWNWSSGTLTVTNSTVSGNTAGGSGDGGGLANEGGVVTLTNTTVSGNSAQTGGGIHNGFGTLTLTNSTVSGNAALIYGGGIENYGTLTLTNSTVSGNTTEYDGGGVSNRGGVVTVTNSTLSENNAASGGAMKNWEHWSSVSSVVTIRGSVVDGGCETEVGATTISNGHNIESPGDTCGFDEQGDQASITAEQLNLGPLANNGGPTMTHEPGDGEFGEGSVAIDRIAPEACLDAEGAPLTTDQRGLPRPAGTTDPKRCDVGAVEVQ